MLAVGNNLVLNFHKIKETFENDFLKNSGSQACQTNRLQLE